MAKRTRRVRHEPPKVWHNPDVVGVRRGTKATKAEAHEESSNGADRRAKDPPRSGRIVAAGAGSKDEKTMERERLLGKLRLAEGRTAITRAADELWKCGHELPHDDQDVHLQLLEHSDEERVRTALTTLSGILEREPPKRFAVLDQRLRRLEEFSDDEATRAAAAELRRRAKPTAEARRA